VPAPLASDPYLLTADSMPGLAAARPCTVIAARALIEALSARNQGSAMPEMSAVLLRPRKIKRLPLGSSQKVGKDLGKITAE
jgi:hypothetical protein